MPDIIVERLEAYRPEDAIGIGLLMPDLNPRLSSEPIDESVMRAIIESPDREQFVARTEEDGKIVGSAVLNLIVSSVGRKAWLDDFVTSSDPAVRGTGAGSAIWDDLIEWCDERNVSLNFSSSNERADAHGFYLRRGAVIRNSSLFSVRTNRT